MVHTNEVYTEPLMVELPNICPCQSKSMKINIVGSPSLVLPVHQSTKGITSRSFFNSKLSLNPSYTIIYYTKKKDFQVIQTEIQFVSY